MLLLHLLGLILETLQDHAVLGLDLLLKEQTTHLLGRAIFFIREVEPLKLLLGSLL